jgi:prepilin-type N-terminal cleavage/methylation domain-containing protein
MHNHRGFALLEVVVAAAILVVLAAGVAQVVAGAIRERHASRLRTIATMAAAARLEQLRSGSSADSATGIDYLDTTGAVAGSAAWPPQAVFVRRWTAQAVNGHPDLVAVHVDVATRDGASTACLSTVLGAR